MDFKAHLEKTWNLTLKHIAPLIVMTLVLAVASFVTLGILLPVATAGYMHSILRMIREGREPHFKDIFSHMRLFLPLLLFGAAVFVVITLGFMLLVLPGLVALIAVSYGCLYMLPLMTDKGLGLVDAVKESFRMSTGRNTIDHIAVWVLFMGFSLVGGSVFIGWLLTQPFATVFLLSVYEEKVNPSAPSSGEAPEY